MTLDTIIHGGYVVTMEGPGTGIINDGAVGIKDNRIVAVGETAEILKTYSAHRCINAKGKAVLPGFVDVHMHTGDTIVRSCAQDLSGIEWRFKGILPLLGLAEPEDFVRGSQLNIIEALKSGTTTFGDYYSPMLEMVENHVKLGTRAVVSGMVNELPRDVSGVELGKLFSLNSSVGNAKLEDNTKLIERYHQSHNGRILCRYGPHSPAMCSPELLREIHALAEKYDVGIFLHLAQTEEECSQTQERTGLRPVALLEKLGYLDKRLLAAHMTYATMDEVRQVAQSGAALALCSNSISIVRGALPPAQEFAAFGGRVGLGTDQANNCTMMFNEMKYASLIHKYKNHDATQFPAWKVLRMATIEAADVLGIADRVGSLRAGKLADLILVDLSEPHMNPIMEYPIRTLVPNLVYSARGHEVQTVMIDGKIVVENRKLLTADEDQVIRDANESGRRISARLAKQSWAKDLPLAQWTAEGYY